MVDTIGEAVARLEADGFHRIDEGPRTPGLRVGARVHNRAEQFHRAFIEGTATVVAILRRGTDERPDSWERRYGRPNVEVIVRHDRDADGVVRAWADYGTWLAEEQAPDHTGRSL